MRRRLLAIAAAARGATAAGGMRVEYKKPLPSAKCVVRPDQEQESQASEGTQAGMNEQYWPATVQQCLVFMGIARAFRAMPIRGHIYRPGRDPRLQACDRGQFAAVAGRHTCKNADVAHSPNGLDAGQRLVRPNDKPLT